ncbi:tRNA adenosine(34) deaminase TadA [Desulfovibrio sp. TomC]|uniref:tRNA adenosine(34) deaminase TadA n=1 Tax=Desulfovibrio sp. TomC TaxID=1562888 RepID=UPI0005744EDF|nr:tRNA adenosine(34) deaminase TadA [Desulfovibrio sp. TomC]KHK04512.1 tRNA-specific adenosine-34 deaminase [Desulfovibrio sp. TomC]
MALKPAKRFDAGTDALPPPPPGWASYEALMELALEDARQAAAIGESPVGAVIVSVHGEVLARAGNAPISSTDPTAHAEVLAIRRAATQMNNYRLLNTTLVVTLEPCLMCLGAIVHARVDRLVYGASDPRTGAVTSRLPGPDLPFLNHRFDVVAGVMAEECGTLLRDFFRSRRSRTGAEPARPGRV